MLNLSTTKKKEKEIYWNRWNSPDTYTFPL